MGPLMDSDSSLKEPSKLMMMLQQLHLKQLEDMQRLKYIQLMQQLQGKGTINDTNPNYNAPFRQYLDSELNESLFGNALGRSQQNMREAERFGLPSTGGKWM